MPPAPTLRFALPLVLAGSALGFQPCEPTHTAKLPPAEPGSGSGLRTAIAIPADTLVATNDTWGVVGADGIAHVFARRQDGTWAETAQFWPEDIGTGDLFGVGLNMDAGQSAILAPGDPNAGGLVAAAFVYELLGCPPCLADCVGDGDGDYELFDVLCSVNAFNTAC